MIEYVILVIGAAFVVMTIVLIAIIRDAKRDNIRVFVLRTFNRSDAPLMYRGHVKLFADKGELMSELYIRDRGKPKGIGTFPQKFFKPFGKKEYLIMLEEFDFGRYRPLERIDAYGLSKVYGPRKDEAGNEVIGPDGMRVYEEHTVRVGLTEPVPNDDFDFILKKKEEIRERYKTEEKRNKWLAYAAGGFLIVVVCITLGLSAYWNYETIKELRGGTVQQTQIVSDMIYKLFRNDTVQEAVKEELPPPPG